MCLFSWTRWLLFILCDICRFNQGYTQGFNQGGGFQRGGKRKSDMDDFSGHAKRQFGNQRGGIHCSLDVTLLIPIYCLLDTN